MAGTTEKTADSSERGVQEQQLLPWSLAWRPLDSMNEAEDAGFWRLWALIGVGPGPFPKDPYG